MRLIPADWTPSLQRPTLPAGVSYCVDLLRLCGTLHYYGAIRDYEITGAIGHRVTAIRSKKHGVTVLNPLEAFVADTLDEAAEIYDLAQTHLPAKTAHSLLSTAASIVDATTTTFPPMEYLRPAMYGGLQWSIPDVSMRNPKHVGFKVCSDIVEAYTTALLRRPQPMTWKFTDPQQIELDPLGLDTFYHVNCYVPLNDIGFPTTKWGPGSMFTGWARGEELVEAGLHKSKTLTVLEAVAPVFYTWHPKSAFVCGLPKPLRKRLGNSIYGMHAKDGWRYRVTSHKPHERAVPFNSDYGDFYWTKFRALALGKVDLAARATSLVRAEVRRRMKETDGIVSVYVDSIVSNSPILPEPEGENAFRWTIDKCGMAEIAGPALLRYT